MLIVLYLTTAGEPVRSWSLVLQALFLIVLLIGFMYGMDTVLYRAYRKRLGQEGRRVRAPKTK